MEDNTENYENLYTIAVMRYKEEHLDVSFENLFPIGWHLIVDTKLKIKIIAEALQKHILVTETNLYKNSLFESESVGLYFNQMRN